MSENEVVVAGEADESDVEDDDVPGNVATSNQPAMVISGEAVESDEDISESGITPLKLDVSSSGDHEGEEKGSSQSSSDFRQPTVYGKPYQFDTLLHRKLRERNLNLRRQLECYKTGVYSKASKDVQNITQQLIKSQTAIQDVTSNMRLMTNDLFHLEDRIDIVCSCNILPNIRTAPPITVNFSSRWPILDQATTRPSQSPSTSAAAGQS